MDAADWYDLASVYRAGADRARGWCFNGDRQQDADILEAQADRCEEIGRERDGNPPVVHDHDHFHTGPDGKRLRHQHKHSHGKSRADHDPDPTGHWHQRDPFAPLPPLSPLSPPERSEP
jgi:hypothetical protein